MPSFILTDTSHDLWMDHFEVTSSRLGLVTPEGPDWSVSKRTLRGGRRAGIDLIHLNNGALSLEIVPTRGMGIWKGRFQGDRLGWDSPVTDGPVHPSYVNLNHWGGLGWLEGFDELLIRCGLENNGPPFEQGGRTFTLHGRIANIPAHSVAVRVDEEPPHALTVEGQVDEAKLFGVRVRMTSRITTTPGSNHVTIRDEFRNLGDRPTPMQVLYHYNFGPPHLEAGSQFVAPVRTVVPISPRAAEGIDHYDLFAGPEPGFAEQVYLCELFGHGPDGQTLVMLHNARGTKAVVLRFFGEQLPCFTLWKNTAGLREGYVTGLEPATNFPNPYPFEKEHGRVVMLDPDQVYVAEVALEVLHSASTVAQVEQEIQTLQAHGEPTVHRAPVEPFSPAGS